MQLSASPASIAPLSAAFIASEQTAAAGAGATTDFAQVFASLGSGAASPVPVATPVPFEMGPEGKLMAEGTSENPAAALTCASARVLFLPAKPPVNAPASGQPVVASAQAEVAAEVGSDERPTEVLGSFPRGLSLSGRKQSSARGEAPQPGLPRPKSAPARPAATEELAVAVASAPTAPIVPPPTLQVGGLVAAGAAGEQPADAAGATPEGLDSAVRAGDAEIQFGSEVAPRLREVRRGATRAIEPGGFPSSGSARGLAPGSGVSAARPSEGRIAADSLPPGEPQAAPAFLSPPAALPAIAADPNLEGYAALGFPPAQVGGAPLAPATEERGTSLSSPNLASGDTRAITPFSLPTPASEPPVAPPQAGATFAGGAGEAAAVIEVGRVGWTPRNSAPVPLALEQSGAREEEAAAPSDRQTETEGPDFLERRTIDSLRPTVLRALVGAPQAGEPDVSVAENIAGRPAKSARAVYSESAAPLKHIEYTSGKELTSSGPIVGTHAAKPEGSMPVPPSMFATVDASLPARGDFAVREATGMSLTPDFDGAQEAAAPALAGRAVEAVLTAADRLVAGDRSSVRLEFALGESELSVRVALRDNAVRATFQTDSPELRAALAHEWQAMTSGHGDRSFQFAPPAFQTSQGETSSQGALAGDFSRQQRDGQSQRANEREFTGPAGGHREPEAGRSTAAEPGRTELPGYSLHLHTLA